MSSMRTGAKVKEGFGNRLKKILKITGTSQRDFSDMMGMNEGNVSRYIRGTRNPKVSTVKLMADVLGIDSSYLLSGDEEALQELVEVCEEGDDGKWS